MGRSRMSGIGRAPLPSPGRCCVPKGGRKLVPFKAECHAQNVLHGDPFATGLLAEVGVFRELVVEFCFRRRHLAGRERNAIDQNDHALGHRAQVMQHVGRERLVLAASIVLEHERPSLTHEKRVQPAHPAVPQGLRQALPDGLR